MTAAPKPDVPPISNFVAVVDPVSVGGVVTNVPLNVHAGGFIYVLANVMRQNVIEPVPVFIFPAVSLAPVPIEGPIPQEETVGAVPVAMKCPPPNTTSPPEIESFAYGELVPIPRFPSIMTEEEA